MKIVKSDNFGRDHVSDELIADNVTKIGEEIVEFLNERFSGQDSPDHFRLVHDDYILYEFKP